jgi:hypothetical protein
MKNYEVTVKAVTTKTFYIEAPSQEEAETVALILNLPKESQDDLKAFLPVEYRFDAHYKEYLTLDVVPPCPEGVPYDNHLVDCNCD